jgi:hypothetical protein
MYKISICCIVKNEKDLLEWLIYHKLIGFDHIYIYDNNDSPININLDFCTTIRYPGEVQQINAYNHYLNNYKQESEYVCALDADEYVVLHEEDNIKKILEKLPSDHDGFILNWKLFINNNKKREEGLVFEKNKKWQKNYLKDKNRNIIELLYNKAYKTIAKTSSISTITSPHFFNYNKKNANVYCGDLLTKVEKINNPNYYLHSDPKISINHYYVKSLEELKEKCERGRATCSGKKKFETEIKHVSNLVENATKILDWVDVTKEEMNKYVGDK